MSAFGTDSSALDQLSLTELKERCKAAGTPCTGSKATLITYLQDPANNQKYNRDPSKPKKTIAKTPKAKKPKARASPSSSEASFSSSSEYGGRDTRSPLRLDALCEDCQKHFTTAHFLAGEIGCAKCTLNDLQFWFLKQPQIFLDALKERRQQDHESDSDSDGDSDSC